MEDFDLNNLQIPSSETLYTIGSIIAGIYYGFKKFMKKETDVKDEAVDAEMIKLLKLQVENSKTMSELQQERLKLLKDEKEELEKTIDDLKKQLTNRTERVVPDRDRWR